MSNELKQAREQRYVDVDLTDSPGILYVNSIKARNLRALFWIYQNIGAIRDVFNRSEGCVQFKIGMITWREFVVTSYWRDQGTLNAAYKDPEHIAMMRRTFQHLDDFELANETFTAPITTRYLNGHNGFARMGETQEWDLQEFFDQRGSHQDAIPS